MNRRYFIFLIAGLWLAASASARAGHELAPVDYAAERLARSTELWRTTTHYADGRSQQAWLAAALFEASRGFNDQVHYRRPFDQVWASWEVLAARFFEARELRQQLAYSHGAKFYGPAPSSYYMGHHQGYASMYARSGYGATYEVVQESWQRMADAFYELHDAIRLERDRYYARNTGYRYPPTKEYRKVSVSDRYYRR
jgi:hypothetical protein